jgi:hypothetical protein
VATEQGATSDISYKRGSTEMAEGQSNGNGNGYYGRVSTIIQTVTVVSLFVAGFWGAVILPLKTALDDIDKSKLTVNEHGEFKYRLDRELSEIREKAKDFALRLELQPHWAELTRLQSDIVPRGEHLEHWRSVDQQFIELKREIDAVRSQVGNTYTLGDEIKRLQHDMELMRAK